jgi:hypothetical protein
VDSTSKRNPDVNEADTRLELANGEATMLYHAVGEDSKQTLSNALGAFSQMMFLSRNPEDVYASCLYGSLEFGEKLLN